MAVLIDVLNPECIVIGGLAMRFGDLILRPAFDSVRKEALKPSLQTCKIVPAALGERIGDVAALCVSAGAVETDAVPNTELTMSGAAWPATNPTVMPAARRTAARRPTRAVSVLGCDWIIGFRSLSRLEVGSFALKGSPARQNVTAKISLDLGSGICHLSGQFAPCK